MSSLESQTYFEDYRRRLGENWANDDAVLQAWVKRAKLSEKDRTFVESFGARVATEFRELADAVDRADALPRIVAGDAAKDVELPEQTWRMLSQTHGSGLWNPYVSDAARYAVVYLLNMNGEAGVACSVACTDGLVRIMRRFGDTDRNRRVLQAVYGSTPEQWVHGAQFVTEIQGGSDAGRNLVEARSLPDGSFQLFGLKWFCSNLTADHWLVTARYPGGPAGVRGVGLFLVPRLVDGERNAYLVERLKDKLGTRALPTGEIRFQGALGWPVGPLEDGLKNMVATVLVTSRVHNVVASAAFVRSAARHASAYAAFRTAFGSRVKDFPVVSQSLQRLEESARAAGAGAFCLVDDWLQAQTVPESHEKAQWVRFLVSIAKAVSTRRAHGLIYEAMMAYGGNGIEERFSPLPRLWRDAAILETWEGPYSLLMAQALRDLVRMGVPGREGAFFSAGLGADADPALVEDVVRVLRDPEHPDQAKAWPDVAWRVYEAYEADGLRRLGLAS